MATAHDLVLEAETELLENMEEELPGAFTRGYLDLTERSFLDDEASKLLGDFHDELRAMAAERVLRKLPDAAVQEEVMMSLSLNVLRKLSERMTSPA